MIVCLIGWSKPTRKCHSSSREQKSGAKDIDKPVPTQTNAWEH